MAEGFVRLRSYWSPDEAHLAKLHLESHGIQAELNNANFVATSWIDANAVGGVVLLVEKADVEEAEQLLDIRSPVQIDESQELTGRDSDQGNDNAEEGTGTGDDDSSANGVLTGFQSLKRPILRTCLFLLYTPLLIMLIGWMVNVVAAILRR